MCSRSATQRSRRYARSRKRALTIDRENATAYYTLAIRYGAFQTTKKAHSNLLAKATQLKYNFAPGYFALAVTSTFLGRPEDALMAVDTALRLSPNDPQSVVWRAQRASALYLLKRYSEAIDTARQSLALRWFHTACRVLAASYAQLGMIEKAQAAMCELLASDKGDKSISAVIRPFRRTLIEITTLMVCAKPECPKFEQR